MMDKSHCFMNTGDELEFAQFYDFSQYFESIIHDLPKVQVQQEESEEKPKKPNQDEDWEEVDIEDANEEDLFVKDGFQTPSKSESSASFSIIDSKDGSAQKKSQAAQSSEFTLLEPKSNTTEIKIPFNDQNFCGESVSSIPHNEGLKQGKKVLTKEEAYSRLNIKKPELLSTGEVRLPNGKV